MADLSFHALEPRSPSDCAGIVADEVHDFAESELRLLRAMVPEGPNDRGWTVAPSAYTVNPDVTERCLHAQIKRLVAELESPARTPAG